MNKKTKTNDFFQTSNLTLLVSYTFFATMLIVEALLMGWEKWVLVLFAFSIFGCWRLLLNHKAPTYLRIWIYALLMMACFFFYGVHLTSTYDLAIVMSAIIILYILTGMRVMITMCQITYYITMAYSIVMMIIEKTTEFDVLVISRTVMHCAMIFMIGWLARTVIDKWTQVLNKSKDEIVQLTDATERLSDFLANVSHEIRTPINAVIGLSGICIDKEENEEIRNEMISVQNAGRRVAEQIGDILDYSEIDRKKLARNNEDYMLSSVLHDLISEIKRYKSNDVELIIDVDPSIPSIMNSDVIKLKKILKALITNGLKYTYNGGVYVRISSEKHEYGVNLCIEVTDTGIGMSEEELERVYERFYQADSSRSRMGGGLGLGLAIVSGFVSILGGFMTIESKENVGTTVHVSLPQTVVDYSSCMSVANPEKLCLGAYLHFDKFPNPAVREYYNSMVLNIVNGLGVQMYRVDNEENLKKLRESINMTHLFIGPEEYLSDKEYIEELAKEMIVVVVANDDIELPVNSYVQKMEKPFYCFPVVTVLNSEHGERTKHEGQLMCKGVRALVVDDEPMNLVVAKSIFKRYGMEVTSVTSGQESIDICRKNVYDIIFMDHMMGGMDGVEAMKRIRKDVSGLNNLVPVVALTANAMSSAKQMFLSEGFEGFVSKPIEIEELERVLKKVLPKSFISYEMVEEEEVNPVSKKTAPVKEKAVETVPEEKKASDKKEEGSKEGRDKAIENLKPCGIDPEIGLNYCLNDKEFYETLLVQYATEAREKIPLLNEYLSKEDWSNYEIIIHAVKSTSKMIGAMSLFEKAFELEKAAKKKDVAYITDNHSKVLQEYAVVKEEINKNFNVPDVSAGEEVLEFGGTDDSEDEVLEFIPEGAD